MIDRPLPRALPLAATGVSIETPGPMALPAQFARAGWLARRPAEDALTPAQAAARGFEIDLSLDLRVGDERPWTGLATLLTRKAAARARTCGDGAREAGASLDPDAGWQVEAVDPQADLGRRCARASGDWNLHHLWPAAARLVGYRRPIAHGMRPLGRMPATLEPRLAPSWSAEAVFKRPVVLPGRVPPRWRDEAGAIGFEACHPATGEPDLLSRVGTS